MTETQDADDVARDVTIGSLQSTQWATNNQIWSVTPNSGANGGIAINQGATEGARQGNKIRTARCLIKLAGYMEAYNATSNPTPKPQIVKWFVISGKRGVDLNDIADVQAIKNDLYDTGSGSAAANGNLFDILDPINNDKYTIHRSGQFKVYWSTYDGTGNATMNAGLSSNNDFKLYFQKTLNLTKYCPKIIQYNDNSAVPVSKPVWFCMYTVPADGTTPTAATQPIRVKLIQQFRFKEM